MHEQPVGVTWRTIRLTGEPSTAKDDVVATEWPLTIRLDDEEFATIVCSPQRS